MIDEVVAAVRGFRFRYANEEQLQSALADALQSAGYSVEREVRLDARNRIDLLVERVGIEVKVDGSYRDVARQCARYLASDLIDGLVLVTSRTRHVKVAPLVGGKPVRIVELAGAGL